MPNIINPTSISYEEILADVTSYVRSKGTDAWKDFSATTAGATVLELISGLAAFTDHDVKTAVLENNRDTARLKSSLYGMASLLGYPIRRKSAPKLKIKLTLEGSNQVEISRFQPIGTFKSIAIVPLKNYILSPGTNEIYCAVGEWKRTTFSVNQTQSFSRYFFSNTYVENDILWSPNSDLSFPLLELYVSYSLSSINSEDEEVKEKVTLVEYPERLNGNSCLVRTGTDGVLFIFGDGNLGRRLRLTDTLEFTYLQTQGLLENAKLSDLDTGFSVNIGTATEVQLLYPGANEDSLEKLRTIMSGYHASRRRMVTIEDHIAILSSYPGVVSANVREITDDDPGACCSVEASVLFEDGHVLDQASSEIVASETVSITSDRLLYEDSEVYPSSILFPNNGFTDTLTTGTKVWVTFSSDDPPNDVPLGLESGRFYYVIRLEGTRQIRFATDKLRATLGIYVQLNPPVSGDAVVFDLSVDVLADTAKTRNALSEVNVVLEDDVDSSSSFKLPTSLYSTLDTGDVVYVSLYQGGGTPPEALPVDKFVNVICDDANERIRLAQTYAKSLNDDYIQLHEVEEMSGSVIFQKRSFREIVVISGSNITLSDGGSEPGYLDVTSGAPNLLTALEGAPFKVKIAKNTGGTQPPGNLLPQGVGRILWAYNPSANRISFAETEEDAIAQDGIYLTDSGNSISGSLIIDVFTGDEETVSLTSSDFISESASIYSSSIDLGTPPFWVNNIGASPYAGMKVRIYAEEGSEVNLPLGLELGEFYYAIPISGTNRIRFAETYNKATGANDTEVEYIELSDPAEGDLSGYLKIDFFLDSYVHAVDSNLIYYQDASDYLSSINFGKTLLTGGDSDFPFGFTTGTKIRMTPDTEELPGNLDKDQFYYIIRVAGSNNIRFASTRTNALRGIYVPLSETDTVDSSIQVDIYDHPEERKLRTYLEQFQVAGLQILFIDPIPVVLRPEITIVLEETANLATVQNKIRAILAKYTFELANIFYVGDVYKEIYALSEVLRVYIKKPVSDKVLSFNEYLTLPTDLFVSGLITMKIGNTAFVDLDLLPESGDGYDD